jgi:hypothetical protein
MMILMGPCTNIVAESWCQWRAHTRYLCVHHPSHQKGALTNPLAVKHDDSNGPMHHYCHIVMLPMASPCEVFTCPHSHQKGPSQAHQLLSTHILMGPCINIIVCLALALSDVMHNMLSWAHMHICTSHP